MKHGLKFGFAGLEVRKKNVGAFFCDFGKERNEIRFESWKFKD